MLDNLEGEVDEFFLKCVIQFKISGLRISTVQMLSEKSRRGYRIKNYLKMYQEIDSDNIDNLQSKSYVKPETILSTYKVFGSIKKLPFSNYKINENDDVNCFYNHIVETYKKIGKKTIDKFNLNNGVSLQSIINFCDKYKIKCYLYNIAGRVIYRNNYEQNSNHPTLNAVISNNHIYPTTGKPKLIKETTTNNVDIHSDITYECNNNIYTSNGIFKSNEINEYEIDNSLFKGLKPSFTYCEDINKITPFIYIDKAVEDVKYEYDINRAYFTISYEIIKGEYPIFSCFDLWTEYEGDEINNLYYYTLKEKILCKLKKYGINDNLRIGFMVNYLMKHKLITKNDIEYYKKPSYYTNWNFVKNRIDNMINNMVRRKLHLDEKEDITQEHIKQSGIDKEYVFYNGILGKEQKTKIEKIYFLPENEYQLLNFGLEEGEEQWSYDGDGDNCIYTHRQQSYKNLNNTTIYNQVVEMTNLILLKNILYINSKFDMMPLKIKTDAIAYTQNIDIKPKYEKYFKLVTLEDVESSMIIKKENICKLYMKINPKYHDCHTIVNDIKSTLLKFKDNNISYQGAPGVGKTYTVKTNHKYDVATTITNVCCLNITSETVKANTLYSNLQLYNPDNWYKAMKKFMGKTIWIDEYSMVNRFMWNFILLLSMKYKCKMIISGDVNQTPPVGEFKINNDNFVLKCLMGETVVLTKDYRNDERIVKLRNFITENENDKKIIYSYFKNNNSLDEWINYDRHICFTNDCCNYINKKIVEERGYKFKYCYNTGNKFNYLDVSPNVLLSCRATLKTKGIYKRDIWRVVDKYSNYSYKLLNIRDNVTKVFEKELMAYFRLGFAITSHSSQGLTIKGDLCIHEIKKMIYMDTSILYTAITRACKYSDLHLYYETEIEKVYVKEPSIINDGEDEYEFGQNIKCL